jgi:hypothetical protein
VRRTESHAQNYNSLDCLRQSGLPCCFESFRRLKIARSGSILQCWRSNYAAGIDCRWEGCGGSGVCSVDILFLVQVVVVPRLLCNKHYSRARPRISSHILTRSRPCQQSFVSVILGVTALIDYTLHTHLKNSYPTLVWGVQSNPPPRLPYPTLRSYVSRTAVVCDNWL